MISPSWILRNVLNFERPFFPKKDFVTKRLKYFFVRVLSIFKKIIILAMQYCIVTQLQAKKVCEIVVLLRLVILLHVQIS
jgi:hypothetical protein